MKTRLVVGWIGALCVIFASSAALAAAASSAFSAVSAGARYHVASSVLQGLPYGDGDLSYGLAYEYHENAGFWLLGVDYTPSVSYYDTDYTLTPQIDLILQDRYVVGGLGALATWSSLPSSSTRSEWSDVYYQFILGFDFQIGGSFDIRALAYYPFADWGKLGDFSTDDVEYGGYLVFRF